MKNHYSKEGKKRQRKTKTDGANSKKRIDKHRVEEHICKSNI